jgi:hypothetical protein
MIEMALNPSNPLMYFIQTFAFIAGNESVFAMKDIQVVTLVPKFIIVLLLKIIFVPQFENAPRRH